ncbi:MAG: hypothetical protein ACUVQP_03935 [Bacteroidales bacterium]
MKALKLFISILFIGTFLFSCSSETNNEKNSEDIEVKQIMNTMQQSLDTNNIEIVMERDTTK